MRKFLFKNGVWYVWENQTVINGKLFIKQVVQRLKYQYIQTWNETCKNSTKLSTYELFQHTFETENYLQILDIKKYRYSFVSFRCSSHHLMIDRGRHEGVERERRFSPFSKNVVEDEYHFVLVCPLYSDYRSKYIQIICTR